MYNGKFSGSELYLYKSLWRVTQLASDLDPLLTWFPQEQFGFTYEDAILHAYVLSSEANIMGSNPLDSKEVINCDNLLFTVSLQNWRDYYSWRGLNIGSEVSHESSLLALLLHWPLTLYHIIAHKLPLMSKFLKTFRCMIKHIYYIFHLFILLQVLIVIILM